MSIPVAILNGDCPFCFGRGTASMKLDKKGAPYFICQGCATRAFIHSPLAVKVFSWCLSNGVSYYAAYLKSTGAQVPATGPVAPVGV